MRRKRLLFCGLLLGCSSQVHDESENVGQTSLALTADQARVFGFETPLADWSSAQGTLSSSGITSQGSAAVGVTSIGWTEVASRTLSSLGDVGTTISYDIRLPQATPWGETRVIIQIPSRGITWQDLGSFNLAGRAPNVFHRVTFNLPPSLITALESTYSDLVIRVVVNKPALSGPVIIDNLDIGAAPPSGSGGAGGGAGSGGTAGTGGSTAGASGSTGSLAFSVEVPYPHTPEAMTLVAAENLRLNDRVTVGAANASSLNASFGGAYLAAGSGVNGSLYDDGTLFLGSSSRISEWLVVTGAVTRQSNVVIGTETHVASIPSTIVTFNVPTGPSTGNVFVNNGQSRTLTPGHYGTLSVQSNADLYLSSGTYTFSSFNIEPQGDVFLSKASGPIQVFVTGSPFQFKGRIVSSVGPIGDFLVGYLGTQDAALQGPFLGTFLAPNGKILLQRPSDNSPHRGAFFGRSIDVASDSTVLHEPFPWDELADDPDDGTLHGDPDFPPVGPGDVPGTTPTPVATDNTCTADFDAVINPNVDANGDGLPDIVQLTPRTPAANCPAPAYCQRVVGPDGSETFVPVAPTPLFDPSLPYPAGAVTNGCSGEPASPVCPVLASTGQQAEGCSAEPADPNCNTVTLCPDPGSFDDPSNPDIHHDFDGVSYDTIPPGIIPPGVVDNVTGEVRQILEELGPLYINPCEWDPVLAQFGTEVNIKGTGLDGGETCQTNADCRSGLCEGVWGGECAGTAAACTRDSECGAGGDCVPFGLCDLTGAACKTSADCGGQACNPPLILTNECAEAKSPLLVNLNEGSSDWNVKFNGGVSEGRAGVERAVFFPSTSFDVTVDTDAHLSATAFGRRFDLFDLDILSEITECGFNFDWTSRTGDDDFQIVDGLIRETLGVGAFVPGNVAAIQRASDPVASATCVARLTDLRNAERAANEAFHDALIASTFYNLAGANGSVITSRDTAQDFVDGYVNAAAAYQSAIGAYNPAQQAALDHLVSGQVLDFEFNVEFSFVRAFGIGPFNPGIDVGLYGRAGISNVEMENRANTHFTNTVDTPCGGTECFELGVKGSAAPKAAVGLFAFIGGGINLAVAGGKVGIRGELDLANFQLPLAAEFALKRTTLPASALVSAIPGVPPSLTSILPTVADFAQANLFEVPPLVAQINAPYAIGGNLEALEGASLQGQFLSGRIKLWAKAWFLFVTKKWEKTLVSWDGKSVSWHVADPISGDAFAPFVADLGFNAVPNMVLLPKLALVPTPGNADPVTTSAAINDAFDTQTIDMPIDYDAHEESDLGRAWLPSNGTPSGRCEHFTPDPPK